MRIKIFTAIASIFLTIGMAQAQEWPSLEKLVVPETPPLLTPLEEKGAQIRYLGKYADYNGWVVYNEGVPTFTYSSEDGRTYFQGMMFNEKGENLTLKQLQDFRLRDGEDSFDSLNQISRMIQERQRASNAQEATKQITQNLQNSEAPKPAAEISEPSVTAPEQTAEAVVASPSREPATPVTKSDRLMQDLQNANWVSFGDVSKPEIYAMIDPDCSHCRQTMTALKPYLEKGALELRVLPVGFELKTKRIGALMLAAGDPQTLYYTYIAGKAGDLGKSANVNTQGIDRNLMTVNSWGFDVTPMLFYRNAAGEVKIIRGVPANIDAVLQDLAG